MEREKHLLVYCSPAGSTKIVASFINDRLQDHNCQVTEVDLAKIQEQDLHKILWEDFDFEAIWLGSPVYAQHAIPPVQSFLEKLPQNQNKTGAVPFITWGAVCSGTSLYEMGKIFQDKGYPVLGGAKILAVHSVMWRTQSPLGSGHPNDQDASLIEELVDSVRDKIKSQNQNFLNLQELNYQPDWIQEKAQEANIQKTKEHHPGFTLDKDLCAQCGTCAENCPVQAITLNPYPEIDSSCFLCHNCVRFCPEGAMQFDTTPLENRIMEMKEKFREPEENRIFV